MPVISALTSLLVIALYLAGSGPWSFAWHLLPILTLVLYGWYVFHWLAH